MKTIATPLVVAAVLLLAQILPTPDWALIVLLFPAIAILIWWGWNQWQMLNSEEDALNQRIKESSPLFTEETEIFEDSQAVNEPTDTAGISEKEVDAVAPQVMADETQVIEINEEPDENFSLGNNWR